MSASPLCCPFCESADIELVSAFGGQLITSQVRCRGCNTHFEVVRSDFDAPAGTTAQRPPHAAASGLSA